jgi:hypothetical protein
MSDFEVLSILVACIALVISLVTFNGQRRLQREANELQKTTAALSKRQLELIDEQERVKTEAKLSVSLSEDGRGHKLVIRSLGPADATDVEIQSLGTTPEDVLLVKQEVDAKFPVRRLRPSEEIRMIAAVYLGSPLVFKLLLKWRNGDGSPCQEEYTLGL